MKRILITGINSYVGKNLNKWLRQYPHKYEVDMISLRDNSWKKVSFAKYDVIVHCVGIAHQKETKQNEKSYYQVNRDLTFEVAKKAKQDKVAQFIFLSSMSVYGLGEGIINEHTPLKPNTNYGKSKIQAERLIKPLSNDKFRVAIIRPPMIYGKDCKGNYQRLAKLAMKTPIFPDIENKRSMIYIHNLSEFLRIIIDRQSYGLFFPQNKKYVCTSDLVYLIAKANGKKIYRTKIFNPIIKFLNLNTIKKVFGDLMYSKKLIRQELEDCHSFIELERSIKLTEE